MKDQPNYYSILTAEVRYDSLLTWFERIMYAELSALANKTGECWASNKWFSDVFKQSTRTITRAITRLSERGYIKVSFEYEGKQISKRIVKIALPMDKKVMGSIDKNVDNPIDKNVRDNNTSNNNTSINIYVRDEEDFQRFWDKLQGRKKNKNDAKRAYLQIDAEISAEELASKFNQLLNTREEKYVPYPQKWLKNEGWLEEVKEESTSNAFMSDTGVYRDVDGYIISKEEYEKLQGSNQNVN